VRSADVGEAAILDGTLVIVGFNLINRVASALHFETPCPRDFLLSAWFLRIFGYRFLSGLQISSVSHAPVLEAKDENRARCGDRAALVDPITKWLEQLEALGHDALWQAPSVARGVIHKIECEPASVTDKDVAGLKSYGCSEDDMFNLILAAAARSCSLRLEAGLRAIAAGSFEKSRPCTPQGVSETVTLTAPSPSWR
jgi:hypothetical protein